MKQKPKFKTANAGLRRRAEVRLRKQSKPRSPKVGAPKSAADKLRLLHELQVHQVELELQNAELQEARDRMEAALEKYTDLYDFAPVGYFSLDEQGQILEANLMGAAMLGLERSQLIHRRITRFVAPASQAILLDFLKQVFAGHGKQACEATLLKADGQAFWANLHATSAASPNGPRTWCRMAVSDITALKRAEEAQRRLEVLGVENRELALEIVRRQVVEAALKRSQQSQNQLLEESQHMQEQLRYLTHRILHAQEEERRRISRELHDEITQTLVGINVHLESLTQQNMVDPLRLKQRIARTQRLVEKSVGIVHQFARELRPAALDDLGLAAALHSFLKDFAKRTGIRVRLTTFAGLEELSDNRRTVLYRVAHAALTNVAQHAEASQVKVSIRKLKDTIYMSITDNGKSFDAQQVLRAKTNKHLGLL
ncbi:MAG: PAS domain S-box protein, partial [Verrucomicrobia bacterium]|nr:PAS domain S-box protein [Verrucomicrobiota bacterium]